MPSKYIRPNIPQFSASDVKQFCNQTVDVLDKIHNIPGQLPYVTEKTLKEYPKSSDLQSEILDIVNSGALDGAIFLRQHRVGSIVMSTANTNPGTIYGGTWAAWGAGRVPVGVYSADSDFNAAEKSGGEKAHTLTENELPAHTFTVAQPTVVYGGTASNPGTNINGGPTNPPPVFYTNNGTGFTGKSAVTSSAVGAGATHNNMPPYLTCYMWKRTA